jgi:hypothetical protein
MEIEDERIRRLLAPLDQLEPVRLRKRSPRLYRARSRRRIFVAIATGAGLISLAGAAIAAGVGPFSGITAADHPPSNSDTISPAVVQQIHGDELAPGNSMDQIGARDLGSARRVGTLASGRDVYLVATSKGRLCVVVATLAESCGDPLTQASPITFTVIASGSASYPSPPIAYGVARDGVAAVSFLFGGQRITVPVHDNFFAYEADGADSNARFSRPSVTFSDGTTEPLNP